MAEHLSDIREYDVVVVGAGASGAALLYTLARYTDVPRLALVEKYDAPGMVNSNAKNNSQTLHVGDIETNYSVDKVRQVYPAAMMVKRYTDALPALERARIIHAVQKMVLGVGAREVAAIQQRYQDIKMIFPDLERLDREGIRRFEPEVMNGRRDEPVLALKNQGFAVNYSELSRSFVEKARAHERVDALFDTEVVGVRDLGRGYELITNNGTIRASVVVFDTDAYSLLFAKRMGYGKEFSLIPIAGSFYFTPKKLNGKVYRVQDPRMPFAAVHGDPELTESGVTRWGPTARFYPVLEARRFSSIASFFAASGFNRVATWISFATILFDPVRFWYLLRNLFYDLPYLGTLFLLPELRKIVPTMRWSDLRRATGYGGMRLQRVDTRTRELLLGEGKIVGRNIIFNMTPSPGASVCLYNAMRDADTIVTFLPAYRFDKQKMLDELCITQGATGADVSLETSYAS